MFGRIYHVGLTVSDLERSIAFYRDVLGLEFQGEIFMEGEETDKMFRRVNCKAKSDYEIKLKQQEIVQEVGNANMLTKALIDRLINKVYVFPGDRIEIEYATQDFLETKESEKEV